MKKNLPNLDPTLESSQTQINYTRCWKVNLDMHLPSLTEIRFLIPEFIVGLLIGLGLGALL